MDFRRSFPRFAAAAIVAVALALGLALLLFAARDTERSRAAGLSRAAGPSRAAGRSIAVFIPGVMSGSPIYEMLSAGVQRAAAEQPGVQVKVVEGGFNQAGWESMITSLAASGDYDLIVTSNPAMPALCAAVSAKFPGQKFLVLDGELAGNPGIYTLRYNQREQAYLAGHIAALVTVEAGANKIGLVAGQEYPAMNDIILPGYLEGARAVSPDIQVDFRVVGNWFDAARGAELASAMIRDGVSVILTIAGGANQGVVQAASEAGAKVVWFNINGYGIKPGTVVGSAILRQDRAAYEQTRRFLEGKLPFGTAEVVGVVDGFVDFVEDDPLYRAAVSEVNRRRQGNLLARLRSGALRLD